MMRKIYPYSTREGARAKSKQVTTNPGALCLGQDEWLAIGDEWLASDGRRGTYYYDRRGLLGDDHDAVIKGMVLAAQSTRPGVVTDAAPDCKIDVTVEIRPPTGAETAGECDNDG